ncbi:hypothetical protein N7519_000638 [Penicillium mononematosum]|uniref:uncharacterized protein n=1 Tax=Penicillium mononematosum TaxID=268346 RepID=UPI002547FE0F|nr:uncharacterized protein N7519_000638 [Penicillium mononematosum]KAJ6190617.1 hypothetical protein N7519_000638 [Penicillium mononematosum]
MLVGWLLQNMHRWSWLRNSGHTHIWPFRSCIHHEGLDWTSWKEKMEWDNEWSLSGSAFFLRVTFLDLDMNALAWLLKLEQGLEPQTFDSWPSRFLLGLDVVQDDATR